MENIVAFLIGTLFGKFIVVLSVWLLTGILAHGVSYGYVTRKGASYKRSKKEVDEAFKASLSFIPLGVLYLMALTVIMGFDEIYKNGLRFFPLKDLETIE